MQPNPVIKTNIAPVRTRNPIMADANGAAPTRIEICKAGMWPGSIKGDLVITVADLMEMKSNYDLGYALPAGGEIGLPIDFSHNDHEKAAGWITSVEVEGDILYGNVEWTKAGREAIENKEFKCFSPSFYPACLGQWYDPENPTRTGRNVLVGGALTNIPFFKDLLAVNASQSSGSSKSKNVIYLSADTKGNTMELATVRNKAPSELTAEESTFLALDENKTQLTAAERVAFGLDGAPATPPNEDPTPPTETPAPSETPAPTPAPADVEASAIQASIKSGEKVLVTASEYNDMKSKVDASTAQLAGMRREKIDASVTDHIKRGAIKASEHKDWADRIEKDATLEKTLQSLPSNEIIADQNEIGKDGGTGASAAEQLEGRIQEAIKASAENGGTPLTYAQAVDKIAREDPQLANQRQTELSAR